MPLPAPQPAPGKLQCLELARFAAAFCVAAAHLSAGALILHLGQPVLDAPASAAVLFFFTLSGFVIHTAHARDAGLPRRLPRYLWRRLMRIYPLYWLSLLPVLASTCFWLLHGAPRTYAFAILSLAPVTGFGFAEYNPPAWTLRCELLFYAIYGFSLLPRLRRAVLPLWGAALLLGWGVTMAGRAGPVQLAPFLPSGLALHLLMFNDLFFFAGLLAAEAHARLRPGPAPLWLLLGASVAALFALGLLSWGNLVTPEGAMMIPAIRVPFIAGGFAGLIFALAGLERCGALRAPRVAALCGAMSYPLYVLQADVWFFAYRYFAAAPHMAALFTPAALLAVLLAAAVLASFLAAALFDRPVQRLARRLA